MKRTFWFVVAGGIMGMLVGAYSCSNNGGGGNEVLTVNAPSNVSATAGDAHVTIAWNAVQGATAYRIYWKTSAGVTKQDTPIEDPTSPYIHAGLTNGTTYSYVVIALNGTNESELSSEVSAGT